MLLQTLRSDHQAGREILGEVGNAPQQAFQERADGFARLAALWQRHGRMLAAVRPLVGATQVWPDPAAAVLELQREVEVRAADLAGREARGDERWRGDFDRLIDAFEQQCRVEEIDILTRLVQAPADRLARIAREIEDGTL